MFLYVCKLLTKLKLYCPFGLLLKHLYFLGELATEARLQLIVYLGWQLIHLQYSGGILLWGLELQIRLVVRTNYIFGVRVFGLIGLATFVSLRLFRDWFLRLLLSVSDDGLRRRCLVILDLRVTYDGRMFALILFDHPHQSIVLFHSFAPFRCQAGLNKVKSVDQTGINDGIISLAFNKCMVIIFIWLARCHLDIVQVGWTGGWA